MRNIEKVLVVFVLTLALVVGTGFLSKAKADDGFESSLATPSTASSTPCVSSALSSVTFTSGDVRISGENGGVAHLKLKKVTDTSVTLIAQALVNGVQNTFS